MLMDRWIGMDPWKAMDRMFNEAFTSSPRPRTGPRVLFREVDGSYELRAPLPGVAREDVEITIDGELVTIKAKRVPKPPEGFEPRRRERVELGFERSYRLPEPIDAERVEARLEHGVLVTTLPRKTREQPRTIAVKAA
jgi:HSP20 family protein